LQLREKQFTENQAQKEYDDEEEDDEYQVPDPTKEPNTRMVISIITFDISLIEYQAGRRPSIFERAR
jgi:hypothetical protein